MREIIVRTSIRINAAPAQVWRILGAFDGLPAISTATVASRLEDGGRVRVITGRNGGSLWERMLHFDEARRVFSYEIIDTKGCDELAYGAGYVGTVQVTSRRGERTATFVYRARFRPRTGVDAKQARAAVIAFAADCAAGVYRVLGLKHEADWQAT